MKLLLTGSDGFVGSLLKRERPCVPLIDDGGNVAPRDADRVGRAIARIAPDAVIHLAALTFVPESFARPRETYEINFFGTLNLLEALKAANDADQDDGRRRHGTRGEGIAQSGTTNDISNSIEFAYLTGKRP